MSASEFFRTFCVFALVLVNILRKILLKTGLWARKILGSRVLAVRRRSRANYQSFLAQNYFPDRGGPRKKFPRTRRSRKKFPRPRRPSEKISQTAMRIVRGRLLDPAPSPSPGEMDSRPPDPRPAAVRECKRVGPNYHQIPPVWPYARHTFCNSGRFRFFGDRVPVPLRVLGPLRGGPMGPLLRRTHGKKFECFCMLNTLLIPKSL